MVVDGDVGRHHTAVVSDQGRVFVWGFGNQTPQIVVFETESAVHERNHSKVKDRRWYETQVRRVPLHIVQVSCSDEVCYCKRYLK